MKCRRVQLQLLDFSTGRLEAGAVPSVANHLEGCADCRRVLQREQRAGALLETMARVEPQANAWPAIESAIRAAARRRSFGWRPLLWAGGVGAATALTVSLVVPTFRAPAAPPEPEALRALAPRAAAGLVPDRSRDPLVVLETKLDRTLDRLADEGS